MSRQVLLDVMLGRLATYLRMCGYETVYALDEGIEADEAIQQYARREERTLLTRDRALAANTPDAVLLEPRDIGSNSANSQPPGSTSNSRATHSTAGVAMDRSNNCRRQQSHPGTLPTTWGPSGAVRTVGNSSGRGATGSAFGKHSQVLREVVNRENKMMHEIRLNLQR